MIKEIRVNTVKLHELIQAIAIRSYNEGYKQGRTRKPPDPDRVKVALVNILGLDQSMKRKPGGRK